MENSSDKENKAEAQFAEPKNEKSDSGLPDQSVVINSDDLALDDNSDQGWQEAVPKSRSLTGRRFSGSKRTSLAKLNTNFINVSQSSRYRGKPTSFTSPKPIPESASTSGSNISVPKKFVKSASFSPKLHSASTSTGGADKSSPASPASSDQLPKSAPTTCPISVQAAGKLFSYKEVALAPPGTIVKVVAEQFPKGNTDMEPSPQVSLEAATSVVPPGDVTSVKDAEEDKVQKSVEEKQPVGSEEEMQRCASEGKQKEVGDSTEPLEGKKDSASEDREAEARKEVISVAVEACNTEAGSAEGFENSDEVPKIISSKTEVLETGSSDRCLEALPDQVTDKTTLLPDASVPNKKVTDENSQEVPNADIGVKPFPTQGEKQDEVETVKETTKKLSAAAPPFNPSIVPVFGSVPVPGFKDHGGILPPPVNIPPMLSVNPVRRSPHQSATARVPYGPRLSGGYNRSGNRVPRSKPSFPNGEHTGEANHFSPPRIMNPHAAEFVPGQPWVPNGYPVSPNGYLASPNGMPVSPTGFPVTPNGVPVLPNGYPAPLSGFPASIDSVESPGVLTADVGAETSPESVGDEKSSTENKDEKQATQNPCEDQFVHNESTNPIVEEKQTDIAPVTDDSVLEKEISNEKQADGKLSKCWGDYSDSEAEIGEVTS